MKQISPNHINILINDIYIVNQASYKGSQVNERIYWS